MKIRLTYDKAIDAWTLSHEDVDIRSAADIDAWRTQLMALLSRWAGRREYLLIDVRGFHVDPAFGAEYGKVAREIVLNMARGVVRYGATDGLTTAQMRLQGVANRYPALLVADREAAIELLGRLRALPESA